MKITRDQAYIAFTVLCAASVAGLLLGIIDLEKRQRDLTCRIARIETYATSAEPLPDCMKGANPARPKEYPSE